ncbi:MAG: hypothetical protein AB7S38_31690 [Vulcanimicrobiota bacterium]
MKNLAIVVVVVAALMTALVQLPSQPLELNGIRLGMTVRALEDTRGGEALVNNGVGVYDGQLLYLDQHDRILGVLGQRLDDQLGPQASLTDVENRFGPVKLRRQTRWGTMLTYGHDLRVWSQDGRGVTFYLLGEVPDSAIKELSR